jgi:alpha-mannosidase
MCFQDLGWAARPNVSGDHIRYTTWREYIGSIADRPKRDWRFSMEDIRCCLPWGEKTIQRIAQQVRSVENRLVVAEKMASMAVVWAKSDYPSEQLRKAWDQVLWAQHHDAWITATTRTGRRAWAWQVAEQTWDAEQACDDIIDRYSHSRPVAGARSGATGVGSRRLRVFNTLGTERSDLIEVDLTAVCACARHPATSSPVSFWSPENTPGKKQIKSTPAQRTRI